MAEEKKQKRFELFDNNSFENRKEIVGTTPRGINMRFYNSAGKDTGRIGEIIRVPTGNCQVACMSYFCNAIDKLRVAPKEDVFDFVNTIMTFTGKCMLLVDVNIVYAKHIKTIFGGYLVVDAPYISTNKSSMNLFLINLYKYRNDYNENRPRPTPVQASGGGF